MLKDYSLWGYNRPVDYSYRIIDDEFDEKITLPYIEGIIGAQSAQAIIAMYEGKGLPVVSNLLKAMLMESRRYRMSMKELIRRNQKYNPLWGKYEKEFAKYMVLM